MTMNFEQFRRTGELSDITVIVDKTEFKLHTFPLFTKSRYFKNAVASSAATTVPYVVRLDNNFPGGAQVFDQLADYFYSLPLSIDQKNIVALRSAACFVQSDELEAFLDKRLDELLRLARARHDLGVPLLLLEQCRGEYQSWAKQSHLIEKCLQSIVDSLTRGSGLQLSKADREILVRLPVEWIIQLIDAFPTETKLVVLPIAKYYITTLILYQNTTASALPGQNTTDHQSAFTPVGRKDDSSTLSNDEKRLMLDQLVKALGNSLEHLPLSWLHSTYEKAVELRCECQSTLSSYLTQAILHSTNLDENLDNLPDDLMATLLERISKHRDEHIKDPQLLRKLSSLIDSYVEQLRQRGTLTSEQFVKLASCIPKEQRSSHDGLLLALDEILKDEKSTRLSEQEREELINQIDFSRVSEETITACKTNQLIPQKVITEAALALCVKLRRELDEAKSRLRLAEHELGKTRTTYTSSSPTRTRQYEPPTRPSSRSRPAYVNNYDLPMTSSVYSYSRYDNDTDFDHILPSRYMSSSVIGRYGSSLYNYRY